MHQKNVEIIHDFCHEASDPHTHPPPIHNCTFFHIPYSKGTKKGLRQWFGPKTPVTVPISIIKIVTDSMPPHYTEAVYYCLLLTWTMTSLPSTNVTAKGKITCSVPLFNWRQKQFYEQQNMKKSLTVQLIFLVIISRSFCSTFDSFYLPALIVVFDDMCLLLGLILCRTKTEAAHKKEK